MSELLNGLMELFRAILLPSFTCNFPLIYKKNGILQIMFILSDALQYTFACDHR